MKWSVVAGILLLALGLGPAALAHHSFAAEFDSNKPVRLQGVLSKIEWSNPHVYLWIAAKESTGSVSTWVCEGASPVALTRKGFQKASAKPGANTVLEGYAAKDGSHRMKINRIYLDNKLVFEQAEQEGQ